jgi:hypothetical protein
MAASMAASERTPDISGTWLFDAKRSTQTRGALIIGGRLPCVIVHSATAVTTGDRFKHRYPFGAKGAVVSGSSGRERRFARIEGSRVVTVTQYLDPPVGPAEERDTWWLSDTDTLVRDVRTRTGASVRVVYVRKR